MLDNPRRPNRSSWSAIWEGQELAIGHTNWLDFHTLTYTDRPSDILREVSTPRALKNEELLKTTGRILIQRNRSREDFAFAGWHSVCEIYDLEIRPEPGIWIRFKIRTMRRID
jgi:hypothetical protein